MIDLDVDCPRPARVSLATDVRYRSCEIDRAKLSPEAEDAFTFALKEVRRSRLFAYGGRI